MKKNIYLPVLIGAISFAHPLFAAAPEGSIKLEAGTEYDSNLGVIELDQYSTESDWAAILNARFNGRWQANDQLNIKGGYFYLSKHYQDNDNFDLAIQQLFVDTSYDLRVVTLGASYHKADADLASRDFLQLQQTSIYASRLIDNRIFLRAATNYQDKDFPGNAGRNAHNTGLAGDVFVFFNQGTTFISAGITSEEEDAQQAQFNYDALSLRGSINHKFSAWGKNNKVQLGIRLHDRDYSSVTPELETKRNDNHRVATLEWEVSLTPKITATSKIEKGNYESNLAVADYSETLASINFAVTF